MSCMLFAEVAAVGAFLPFVKSYGEKEFEESEEESS